MPRVTVGDVEEIIEVDPAISLAPFITVANRLVTKVCAPSNLLDDDDLKEVEKWLSAHFYHCRDRRSSQEQAKGVGASYDGQTGMFLTSSMYGQTALLIDLSGGLASLNGSLEDPEKSKEVTAGLWWVGGKADGSDPHCP